MDSDDSQQDVFANTQVPSKNVHVNENNPHKWENTDFDYPMLVLFLWNGQINPFVLVYLIELDPEDVGEKWLSAILSPASRAKHRVLKMYPEFGVSIFSKLHKSKKNNILTKMKSYYKTSNLLPFFTGIDFERATRIVAHLNKHFSFLLQTSKDPSLEIESVLQTMIKEKPYKMLPSTSLLFRVSYYNN